MPEPTKNIGPLYIKGKPEIQLGTAKTWADLPEHNKTWSLKIKTRGNPDFLFERPAQKEEDRTLLKIRTDGTVEASKFAGDASDMTVDGGLSINKVLAGKVDQKSLAKKIDTSEGNFSGSLTVAGNVVIGTAKSKSKLEVSGLISGLNTRPLRQQIVHRRILHGLAGDKAIEYSNTWKKVRFVYGPFVYAVPGPQAGTKRKFRLYAIYSDQMQKSGKNVVRFRTDKGKVVSFDLGRTWGGVGDHNRDAFSNWCENPKPLGTGWEAHATIEIQTTAKGKKGVLRYLELQTWDFYD